MKHDHDTYRITKRRYRPSETFVNTVCQLVLLALWIVALVTFAMSGATVYGAEPTKPIPGVTVPIKIIRVVDGDTLVCKTPSTAFEWHIRLIATWAPERTEKGGPEAKAWVESYVKKHAGDETLLHIPFPPKFKANPLAFLTMERIPAYVWVGDEQLNEAIVKAGHATKTKRK